jgi:hypothetical protein
MELRNREEAVTLLSDEQQRVQYDEGDAERIIDVTGTFTHHAVELIGSLGDYAKETESEVDEDSESRMGYARRELIEKWAAAQLALSKIAFVIRLDGDAAYDRLVSALNIEGGNIDMRGL